MESEGVATVVVGMEISTGGAILDGFDGGYGRINGGRCDVVGGWLNVELCKNHCRTQVYFVVN